MLTVLSTTVTGKTTCSMDTEKRLGQTEVSIRVPISSEKSMVEAITAGQMEASTTVNGTRIKSKAWAPILGLMVENSKDRGWTIIWMALVFILGLMDANTLESTKMTRSMGMASTLGLMAECIAGAGLKASSMAWESTLLKTEKRSMAFGKRASGSSGSTKIRFNRSRVEGSTTLSTIGSLRAMKWASETIESSGSRSGSRDCCKTR